jgi:hypothetical protein
MNVSIFKALSRVDIWRLRYRPLVNFVKRFVRRRYEWSIGIYVGESLFKFVSPENITNPVLTAKDVTDVQADFVADPFVVCERGIWYMFFEVMNACTNQGEIALATSSDGFSWTYKQIVLYEPFHLSYPYVFKWNNDYYMIPESYQASSVRLYKAVDFPTQWLFVKNLLDGSDYVDSSIFHLNGKWWLFTSSTKNNILCLYYANELIGPWIEHPKSPLIEGNASIARPGGRVVEFDDRIVRYTQDNEYNYGNQVRAFEITELTTTNYNEKEVNENPILKASGTGWNATGMHHIAPYQIEKGKWIACVDGYRGSLVFGLKY